MGPPMASKSDGTVISALRAERGAIGTRLVASLLAAFVLVALALGGAWFATYWLSWGGVVYPTAPAATSAPIRVNVQGLGYANGVVFGSPPPTAWAPSTTVTTAPISITVSTVPTYYLRDADVLLAFLLASLVWLVALWLIWRPVLRRSAAGRAIFWTLAMGAVVLAGGTVAESRPMRRVIDDDAALGGAVVIAILGTLAAWSRAYSATAIHWAAHSGAKIVMPVAATAGIALATFVAAIAVDRAIRRDDEVLVTAVVFLGGAAVLAIWLPLAARAEQRAIRDSVGEVSVHCPKCGYSLVGLTELRCPECGERFTLDRVIAEQSYAASQQNQNA